MLKAPSSPPAAVVCINVPHSFRNELNSFSIETVDKRPTARDKLCVNPHQPTHTSFSTAAPCVGALWAAAQLNRPRFSGSRASCGGGGAAADPAIARRWAAAGRAFCLLVTPQKGENSIEYVLVHVVLMSCSAAGTDGSSIDLLASSGTDGTALSRLVATPPATRHGGAGELTGEGGRGDILSEFSCSCGGRYHSDPTESRRGSDACEHGRDTAFRPPTVEANTAFFGGMAHANIILNATAFVQSTA